MSKVKIKYLHIYTDVRGKKRCYYNRKGYPKTALPLPDEQGFIEAYAKAERREKIVKGKSIKANSFSALVDAYKKSNSFVFLANETKRTYLRFLKSLDYNFGELPGQLTTRQINRIRLKLKDTPDQSNRLLSVMRLIYKNAMEQDLVTKDPTLDLKPLKTRATQGFKTWSEDQIKQYEKRWPLGTREYLAMQCLLQTSQRRSDIVRFSFDTIVDDVIEITQSKTGTTVYIPVLPNLRSALDLLEHDTGPVLRTKQNKPFTPEGFGNWFRQAVRAAGLRKGLSAHGLRKAMCVRLAEVDCTPHEIMAISGHLTLSEVTRYTSEVDRKKLAKTAAAKLMGR